MTAAAATSAPEPQADAWEAAEAEARAVVQRQLQVLDRLAQIGLTIAEALEQQVMAQGARWSRPRRRWPTPGCPGPCG